MREERKETRRKDLNVVIRYLDVLNRVKRELKKTHLQNKVNVNADLNARYLDWLNFRGFITVRNADGRHQLVRITDEGVQALRQLKNLIGEERKIPRTAPSNPRQNL